jgi:hypothetical protein
MLDQILAWLSASRAGPGLLFFVTGYVIVALVTVLILVVVIAALPETYFQDGVEIRPGRRGALNLVGRLARNGIGLILIVLGLLLSLPAIPGQGVLTMLVGLMLLDFRAKRPLERKLVARPRVLDTMNRVRAWLGRPPLVR